MHLSCKLTSTILRYLESKGEETESLLESVDVAEDFLRDPSYWIKADELEHFLSEVLRRNWTQPSAQILTTIAQSCVSSRSWGVLDSVLRMMNSPAEVFSQPQRFLSYFIAPAPPVDRHTRSEMGISFDLPISSEQYPLVTRFMSASFEIIPVFMGRPAARCEWQGIHLSLNWDARQHEIFEVNQMGRQLSPDLAIDILQNLQPAVASEQSVAAQNIEASVMAYQRTQRHPAAGGLNSKSLALHDVGHGMNSGQVMQLVDDSEISEDLRPEMDRLRHHIARLSDYMIRAQQIISLMASAKKLSPEVKEVMRRVDWPIVQTQFPATVEECYQIFRQAQEQQRTQNISHTSYKPTVTEKENPHV